MNKEIQSHRLLNQALQAINSGNIQGAQHHVEEALKINRRSPDAYLMLGIIKGIENLHADAEIFLRKALDLDKKNYFIFFNLAKSLSEQGKDADSLKWHRKAVELNPKSADAWLNYGNSLLKLGELDTAAIAYDRTLQINENCAPAYANKARCLIHRKAYDEAENFLNRALSFEPNLAEAWNVKGLLFRAQKQYRQAIAQFERSLELNPEQAEAWFNLANSLYSIEKYEEALTSYSRAIELNPNHSDAWTNRGATLRELNIFEEALLCHEKAIALDANHAVAWSNKGYVECELKRFKEGLASCERAISIKPELEVAWKNRGSILEIMQRYEEALASYNKALDIDPDYSEVRFNKASLLLKLKKFEEGFALYSNRWQRKKIEKTPGITQIREWEGASDAAKNILLQAEQGVGDEVFYASALSCVDKSLKITLTADKRLISIFKRSFPGIEVVDRETIDNLLTNQVYDAQTTMGSLGPILNLNENRIKHLKRPYLFASTTRKSQIVEKETSLYTKPVCGIAWRSANKVIGADKSIRLDSFGELFASSNLNFTNLQYGDVDDELNLFEKNNGVHIHQTQDLDIFNDIEGLLALIDTCDIVVTTSNVTAHLAGALGKKGLVLVPFGKGRIWYWHENEDYGTWYPSLRIVYQQNPYDWTDAIAKATEWVRENI